MTAASWADFANCADMSTALFFPFEHEKPGFVQARNQNPLALEAKRVCAGCDVREDCLEFAITQRIDHGIFGGLDEIERRRFARERRKQSA